MADLINFVNVTRRLLEMLRWPDSATAQVHLEQKYRGYRADRKSDEAALSGPEAQ